MLEDIEIRLLSTKDITQTAQLIQEEFYAKAPLPRHLHVPPKDAWEYGKPLFEICLNSNASYGAFVTSNGSMIGAALVTSGTTERPLPNLQRKYPLQLRQFLQLSREINPNGSAGELGTSNYLDLVVIVVEKGYDERGLGMEMSRRVLKRARQMGCEFVVVTCTSAYSRKLAERSGFKVIRELVYEDYVDPLTSERILKGMANPHYASTLMYSKL